MKILNVLLLLIKSYKNFWRSSISTFRICLKINTVLRFLIAVTHITFWIYPFFRPITATKVLFVSFLFVVN